MMSSYQIDSCSHQDEFTTRHRRYEEPPEPIVCASRAEALAVAEYWVYASLARDARRALSRLDHRYLLSARHRLWWMIELGLLDRRDILGLATAARADLPEMPAAERGWLEADWVALRGDMLQCACDGVLQEFDVAKLWITRPEPRPADHLPCNGCYGRRAELDRIEAVVLARWYSDRIQAVEELRDAYGLDADDVPAADVEGERHARERIDQLVAAGHLTQEQVESIRQERRARGNLAIADEDRAD